MAKQTPVPKERREFLRKFIEENNIKSAGDIHEALKEMFKENSFEKLLKS